MYSKLSIPVLALAAVVQAGSSKHHYEHDHRHQPSGIFPTGLPYMPSGSAPAPPFPTGVPTGIVPSGATGASGSPATSQQTGDSTLTYTIGSGDHTTVITTTIHHTNTHTDYVYGQHTGVPGDENSPVQGNGNSVSATQTFYLTSTTTNFVYATPSASESPAAADKEADNNSPASGAGGNCGSPSTVTVTAPEVTITVVCFLQPSITSSLLTSL